jgi:hypothetical protein
MSAMLPHVADTSPVMDFWVWLEIDQWRSVQLVIGGNPGSGADPHVPWKTEEDEVEPPEEEDEPEEEEDDDPEPDPDPEDEPTSVPADAVEALGAVGTSSSVLFWNWQPVARIELARRSPSEPLVIAVPYSLVCARTILACTTNWIVRKNQ